MHSIEGAATILQDVAHRVLIFLKIFITIRRLFSLVITVKLSDGGIVIILYRLGIYGFRLFYSKEQEGKCELIII